MNTQSSLQISFPDLPERTATFLIADIKGSTRLLQRQRYLNVIMLADQSCILKALLLTEQPEIMAPRVLVQGVLETIGAEFTREGLTRGLQDQSSHQPSDRMKFAKGADSIDLRSQFATRGSQGAALDTQVWCQAASCVPCL